MNKNLSKRLFSKQAQLLFHTGKENGCSRNRNHVSSRSHTSFAPTRHPHLPTSFPECTHHIRPSTAPDPSETIISCMLCNDRFPSCFTRVVQTRQTNAMYFSLASPHIFKCLLVSVADPVVKGPTRRRLVANSSSDIQCHLARDVTLLRSDEFTCDGQMCIVIR
jgi:hypothetical protein